MSLIKNLKHLFIKYPFLIPALILVVNLILRLARLDYLSIWLDEGQTIFQIRRSVDDIVNDYAKMQQNAPFYFVVMHYWGLIFGYTLESIRAFSAICTSGTAVLVYLIAKKYIGIVHALGISFIFLFSIDFMQFSHEARCYALVGFLATLSFWLYFKLIKTASNLTALLLFAVNLMLIFTHYLTIYLFIIQFVSSLLLFKDKPFFIRYFLSQAAVVLFFSFWLPVLFSLMPKKGSFWVPIPNWEIFMNSFHYLVQGKGHTILCFTIIAIGLLLFLIFRRGLYSRKNKVIFLTIVLWALLPFLANYLLSYHIPVFLRKYTYYASFGFALLIALSLRQLPFPKWLFVVLYMVAGIVFSHDIRHYGTSKDEDWKKVVSIVKSRMDSNTAVILQASYTFTAFAYQFDSQEYLEGNHGHPYFFLKKHNVFPMDQILNNEKRLEVLSNYKVIIVGAHQNGVDPYLELNAFLNKTRKLLEVQKQWKGIDLYFYSPTLNEIVNPTWH